MSGFSDDDPRAGAERSAHAPRVLLAGASGYVGGHLLAAFQRRGVPVRALARDPRALRARLGAQDEVVAADLLRSEGLSEALAGIDCAYYLVHSLAESEGFEAKELACAQHFAAAARQAGVGRIVYLGGLGPEGVELSPHLASRQATGRALRACGVPTLELRASIVLGPGSLSFEMIRALVEHLPVMITPRWVEQVAQPIAIEDLVACLLAARELPLPRSRVLEIGGADRATYGDLMRAYARLRGLRRRMLRVPMLTPRLSGLWLGLVAPLEARVGRRLVESIRHPTVVREAGGVEELGLHPVGHVEAMRRALEDELRAVVDGRWTDPIEAQLAGDSGRLAGRLGGLMHDTRWIEVAAAPDEAFAPVRRLGGRSGWYGTDALWHLRGWIDRAVGGPGMGRVRRDHERLEAGDLFDCWRVERFESGRRVLLAAEMRLPGAAWLEFVVTSRASGDRARIRQSAIFAPRGLLGLAYWYAVLPLHAWVFRKLLLGLAGAAAAEGRAGPTQAALQRTSAR